MATILFLAAVGLVVFAFGFCAGALAATLCFDDGENY